MKCLCIPSFPNWILWIFHEISFKVYIKVLPVIQSEEFTNRKAECLYIFAIVLAICTKTGRNCFKITEAFSNWIIVLEISNHCYGIWNMNMDVLVSYEKFTFKVTTSWSNQWNQTNYLSWRCLYIRNSTLINDH